MAERALILFDVDGTLIDSQAHILAAMAMAFDGVGLARPAAEDVRAGVGLSLPVLMARLCPGATSGQREALVAGYKAAFVALRQGGDARAASPLYPGIAPMLAQMRARAGWLLGTATGKSRRGLDLMIAAHGLEGMFDTLQCADDHPSKPDPAMVLRAIADTGVSPARTVMIGDTTFDMAMAQSAGVAAIGVSWGYHGAQELRDAGARVLLKDAAQIARAVADILGEHDG